MAAGRRAPLRSSSRDDARRRTAPWPRAWWSRCAATRTGTTPAPRSGSSEPFAACGGRGWRGPAGGTSPHGRGGRARLLDQVTLLEVQYHLGALGRMGVVRHDDDRLVELPVQPLEQRQHFLRALGVELAGGLVEQ